MTVSTGMDFILIIKENKIRRRRRTLLFLKFSVYW